MYLLQYIHVFVSDQIIDDDLMVPNDIARKENMSDDKNLKMSTSKVDNIRTTLDETKEKEVYNFIP